MRALSRARFPRILDSPPRGCAVVVCGDAVPEGFVAPRERVATHATTQQTKDAEVSSKAAPNDRRPNQRPVTPSLMPP